MKTLKEMLADARSVVPEQGPAEVKKRIDAGEPLVLIDVRDPDEYRDGFIEPATNISRGFLEFRIGGAAAEPTTPIVLYCQSGLRSMLAAKALKDLGYVNVTNLHRDDLASGGGCTPTWKGLPSAGRRRYRRSSSER